MDFNDFQNGGYMDGLHEAARRDAMMESGHFYELAMEQLRTGQRDENLWAACMAHCEFEKKPAQAMYVRRMAKALEEHHLMTLAARERREEELWHETQRRAEEARERKREQARLEEEAEVERARLEEEAVQQRQEQLEAWRAGSAGHPDKLGVMKWALWGGVIGLVLSFNSVGPWVGLVLGAAGGAGLARMLNYAVEKNQVR